MAAWRIKSLIVGESRKTCLATPNAAAGATRKA